MRAAPRAAGTLAALALAGCQWISGATDKVLVQPAAGAGGAGGAGGSFAGGAGAGSPGVPRGKVDLLLVVDNSSSGIKQKLLASVVEDMIDRLLYPPCIDGQGAQRPWEPRLCPAGSVPAFPPLIDLHLGVITSSLGGHGADYCADVDEDASGQAVGKNFTQNDRGRLIRRGPRPKDSQEISFPRVETWNDLGLLVWAPGSSIDPPGESEASLKQKARELVLGADQIGCGYEAPLEAWYRFLIDPTPVGVIKPGVLIGSKITAPRLEGVDRALLAQRAAFLRPDSLLGILMISDENDCSVIDGALPAAVCDAPITGPGSVDDDGNPTGCSEPRKGWPGGYVEDNFDGVSVDAEGRVTGQPFPLNMLTAQQRLNNTPFHLLSGTPECEEDPYGPSCRQCYTGHEGCKQLDEASDPPNLRCWEQKRRFGFESLYPIRRYLDGLSKPKVYNREGYLVPNPIFAGDRTAKDIFVAAIAGVPWQDIARDPGDLTKGYKPAVATAEAPGIAIDWGLILGDPRGADPARRRPADPLMIESVEPRSGSHPVTGEPIGATTWNSINSREWNTGGVDLQSACTFELDEALDCELSAISCYCAGEVQQNPLCEETSEDGKGKGIYSTIQRRSRALPMPRVLELVKGLGEQGILTSVCTPNMIDPALSNYAYRPATKAIADALSSRLRAP